MSNIRGQAGQHERKGERGEDKGEEGQRGGGRRGGKGKETHHLAVHFRDSAGGLLRGREGDKAPALAVGLLVLHHLAGSDAALLLWSARAAEQGREGESGYTHPLEEEGQQFGKQQQKKQKQSLYLSFSLQTRRNSRRNRNRNRRKGGGGGTGQWADLEEGTEVIVGDGVVQVLNVEVAAGELLVLGCGLESTRGQTKGRRK